MNITDAALIYAANGWPVLPLHRPIDGVCSCGGRSATCKPGKHPRTDLVPRAVKDATLDPHVIVGWPDGINIGVALGEVAGNIMVMDIDIPSISRALLHPNLGLSDHTAVVATGRPGAHIWFRSTGSCASFNLRTEDGTTLGEVRGNGLYVVAPPSLAATGRIYKWVGLPRDVMIPHLAVTEDPLAYITELLGEVGIVLAPTVRQRKEAAAEHGPVTAGDLPPEIAKDSRLLRMRQVLRGQMQDLTSDRSKALSAAAASVAEVAKERGYPLTAVELAGIMKTYDAKAFASPKYAGRAGADGNYAELAQWALNQAGNTNGTAPPETDTPPPETDTDPPLVSTTGLPADYFWDEDDGWLYQRARTPRKVANFKPTLLEELEVYRGAGVPTRRDWHLSFTLKGGRSTTLVVPAENTGTNKLETEISKSCDPGYVVITGMYGHLKNAIAELALDAGGIKGNRVYGTTGWVEHADRWLYLLPAAPGAIAADGIEPTIRIDRDRLGSDLEGMFEPIKAYGQGVRPPLNQGELEQGWEAFEALLTSGPVGKTLPIIVQVMAGPLASAGLDEALPLVHVLGKTGTLKTSYCLAALNIWGRFSSVPPGSWSSTAAWVQVMLHHCKDVTLLVDDYKHRWRLKGLYELLQNYADKSARGRSNPRQTAQNLQSPRGLLLSNGEDLWEDEAATVARTIVVDLMRGDIDRERLGEAQAHGRNGTMQLFGGAYLAWLASQPQILDGDYIPGEQARWGRVLRRRMGENEVHLRLIATIASLLACASVVVRFVRSVYGEERAVYLQEAVRDALPLMLTKAVEQASQVEALTPWQQVIDGMAAGMIAREVCLWPKEGVGKGRKIPDAPRAEIGGFWWRDEHTNEPLVLITKDLSFSQVKRRLRREGEELHISWVAARQDAISRGHRVGRNLWMAMETGREAQVSGVIVPLEAILAQAGGVSIDDV